MEKKKIKLNIWFITTLLFLGLSTYLFIFGRPTGFFVFTQQDIGKKVVDYINKYLVREGEVKLIKVDDKGEYYEIVTEYNGREIPVYATKSGKYLIIGSLFDLEKPFEYEEQRQQERKEIPKTEKPTVKLFIMSYCPFGLQAVKALLPVIDLLKDKANFELHHVYYVMHGDKELYENLRQHCIQKLYDKKIWEYMKCFVKDGNYEKCLSELNLDKVKIENCMKDLEKEVDKSQRYPILNFELEENKKYNVQGSPTLIINDVEVSAERSPEGFKKVICEAFITKPTECNQSLSTEIMSPGFGYSKSSTSQGTC